MAAAPAAFGLSVHSGWAVLVTVAGSRSDPILLDRKRIELAHHVPAQPYHQAAKLSDLATAKAVIKRAHDEANRRALEAISTAIAEAQRKGYDGRFAAVLANQARPLPALEAILASHPLLHAAEGELFRSALSNACEHHQLAVARCPEKDLYEESSRSLMIDPAALRKRIASMAKPVGPPWTADHKAAFVAGWRQLADHGCCPT